MASTDPTHTTTLRERYGQRLRGQLGHLNAAIREGIVSDDVFLLQNQSPEKPEEQEPYDFPTFQGQIQAFMQWLSEQLEKGFLSVVTPEENFFIREAYEKGSNDGDSKVAVDGPEPSMDLDPHESALQKLRKRNYRLLRNVTGDMAREIRDSLTEGLVAGDHSSEIAREITDRMDKVGKHRATLISRTEVINAYSEGSLTQFEQLDIEGVTIEAEILTAHDDDVCELCESIEDMGVFSLSEIRNATIEINGQVVNPKPPVHPQCRCTLLPVT